MLCSAVVPLSRQPDRAEASFTLLACARTAGVEAVATGASLRNAVAATTCEILPRTCRAALRKSFESSSRKN